MTKKRTTLEDLDEEFRKSAEGRPYEEVLALNDLFVAKAFSLGIFSDDNILDGLDDLIKLVKKIHSLKC
ncbi:MAG: hypothetical protein ABII09_07355 [Planctomycetota bacterium]